MCIGIVDSSGVRYFYTDQPPEHEAGILPVGYNVVGHMIIPPNVERYTVVGYCSANCLNTVSLYRWLHTCMHYCVHTTSQWRSQTFSDGM